MTSELHLASESYKVDPLLYANILNAAKDNQYYRQLTQRKFKRKKGYKDYLDIMRYPALFVECAESYGLEILRQQDFSHFIHSCYLMLENSQVFPVYAPSRKLIELLLQTDLPMDAPSNLLEQIKQPFKNALFVLPEGMIEDESGSPLNWLFLNWFDLDDYIEAHSNNYLKFLGELFERNLTFQSSATFATNERYRLKWISLCPDQSAYQSCFGISYEGDFLYGDIIYHEQFFVNDKNSQGEQIQVIKDFTLRVNSLILQLCMYMQTPKFEIDSGNGSKSAPLAQANSESVREYIAVDLPHSYQSPVPKKPHQGGSHASPTTHWRRGHWRNAWVGENRQERKLVWIPPAIVNPTESEV